MSLGVAMDIAQSGLSVLEKKITVTSNNMTNSSTDGYTRQTYTASYTTTDVGSIATSGTVKNSVDQFLLKSIISQTSDYQYKNVISTALSSYDTSLGTTSTSGSTSSNSATISSDISNLLSAFSSLGSDASSSSSKSAVISDAQVLTSELNSLSSTLQDARLKASNDISTGVSSVNSMLDDIAALNKQISSADSTTDTASLEDQRNTDLTNLASQMGIQYYKDSSNVVHVYTSTGDELLGSGGANHLQYTDSASISSSNAYPSNGISGIMLNGKDITSSITSGKIGGEIQLRDSTLVNEQSKLDTLANTLMTAANTVTNQGASVPSRTTMTGSTSVSSTDALSASGTVRIAVTDSSGTVKSYTDVDLSSYSTVGDLVTGLNSISGVSASVTSDGKLQLQSTDSSYGISLNEMSSSVGSSGAGFSSYFGLNNLFDSSNGASTIKVSSYLLSDSSALATGSLSSSSTLAVGDNGVASGDGSTMTSLYNTLNGSLSFAAAGSFAAQKTTLSSYANSIISGVATSTSNASDASDTSKSLLDTWTSTMSSDTGVNINEETANATILENAYSATSQLMSVVKSMFESLLQAVS